MEHCESTIEALTLHQHSMNRNHCRNPWNISMHGFLIALTLDNGHGQMDKQGTEKLKYRLWKPNGELKKSEQPKLQNKVGQHWKFVRWQRNCHCDGINEEAKRSDLMGRSRM